MSHNKYPPPNTAVSTPTGISCGASNQRANTSAINNNTPPISADNSTNPLCLTLTRERTKCGAAAPHLVRSRVRVKHNGLVLLSALMGGVLLLMADVLARWLLAPQEMPVGVLTAVLGGGYLLWLMYRGQTSRGAT